MSIPQWLRSASLGGPLPIDDILDGCTYYPASGLDGLIFSRVWRRAAPCYSFVYVDYGISRKNLDDALTRPIERGGEGLLGYRPAFRRQISRPELERPGHRPIVQLSQAEQRRAAQMYKMVARIAGPADVAGAAYCEWVVFDRLPEFGEDHGPERLSLLFLFADGVAAYDALFVARQAIPRTVIVKQPGHGFGGNYTNFFDHDGPLRRAVLTGGRSPEYLVFGGLGELDSYRARIWSDYEIYHEDRVGDRQSLVFARLRAAR